MKHFFRTREARIAAGLFVFSLFQTLLVPEAVLSTLMLHSVRGSDFRLWQLVTCWFIDPITPPFRLFWLGLSAAIMAFAVRTLRQRYGTRYAVRACATIAATCAIAVLTGFAAGLSYGPYMGWSRMNLGLIALMFLQSGSQRWNVFGFESDGRTFAYIITGYVALMLLLELRSGHLSSLALAENASVVGAWLWYRRPRRKAKRPDPNVIVFKPRSDARNVWHREQNPAGSC